MIAEDYIARGVWPRHSELLPWRGVSDAGFNDDINRPEGGGVIGHMPFFASAAEAAGVKQWITVAALPMDDEQIVYLDAGWVDGMLALRFANVRCEPANYDDVSSVWGYTLAPMDSKLDVLGGAAGRLNYHGAVGCVILRWAPWMLDIMSGPFSSGWYRLYIGIKASVVFFEVEEDVSPLNSWPQSAASSDWDDDNRTPYCRIPDLGGHAFPPFGLSYEGIPDDLFDKTQKITLDNIRELWGLVMLYRQMDARDRVLPYRVKNIATCTTVLLPHYNAPRYRWLSIDVYNFEHCEHVYGCYHHLV